MGRFAKRLAWLLCWDVLGVDPHKCHSTQEWTARLSLPRAAELEVQQIAQEQERQARQPQLLPNESDRLQLPASEAAIAAPAADVALQSDTTAAIQPISLSLTDLLQAMLDQQDGELLLSQVEAIVSKLRFQQAFPQLGQIDRAQLIAAFRQLEAQKLGTLFFPADGNPLFRQLNEPVSPPERGSAASFASRPDLESLHLPAQSKAFLEYCARKASRYADAEGWFHFTKLRTNWAADRGFNAKRFRAFLDQINQAGFGEWMQNDPMKWRPAGLRYG